MRLRSRQLSLLICILAIALLGSLFFYHHRQAVYTASLSTRPFVIGLIGKVATLEPGGFEQHEEKLLCSAIYEGLVRYD